MKLICFKYSSLILLSSIFFFNSVMAMDYDTVVFNDIVVQVYNESESLVSLCGPTKAFILPNAASQQITIPAAGKALSIITCDGSYWLAVHYDNLTGRLQETELKKAFAKKTTKGTWKLHIETVEKVKYYSPLLIVKSDGIVTMYDSKK